MMLLQYLKTLKSQTTMSTNINSNNLPDVNALGKLANELFMALPGNFPNAESLQKKINNLQGSDVTFGQAERFNIKNPQTSFLYTRAGTAFGQWAWNLSFNSTTYRYD